MIDLVKRMRATQKSLDRFQGRAFIDWKFDCLQLIAGHAKHMGKPLKVPRYSSAATAAAALREMGFKSLGEAMDAHFERIAASDVLLGDIVEGPGANGFSSLGIALGGGRALGFHEEVPFCDVVHPTIVTGAWRIR